MKTFRRDQFVPFWDTLLRRRYRLIVSSSSNRLRGIPLFFTVSTEIENTTSCVRSIRWRGCRTQCFRRGYWNDR